VSVPHKVLFAGAIILILPIMAQAGSTLSPSPMAMRESNAHRLHAGPVIAVSERATAVFARVGGEPPPLPGADGAQSRPPPLPPRVDAPPGPLGGARTLPPPLPPHTARRGPPLLPEADAGRSGPPPVPRNVAGGASPGAILRLVQHSLYDRQGWGEAVEAFSLLLPVDWTVSGEVSWGGGPDEPSCMATVPQLIMTARSPDGLWGFEIMPAPTVSYMTMTRTAPNQMPFDTLAMAVQESNTSLARQFHKPRSFCRVTPNTGIGGLVEEALLSGMRPNARILAREPLPEFRAQLQQSLDRQALPDPYRRDEALAFRYVIAVDTPRGPVVEELGIFASSHATLMPSYDGAMQQLYVTAQPVFTFRYPRGRKSEADPLMTVIANSLRTNPRWAAAMAQHNSKMNQINIEGARRRSEIWAETSAAISDMQMEGWKFRSETSDRMMALSRDQIREVEPMRDPTTGQEFELPNAYSTFYRNPQGEFLMSADPNFRASELFPHESWTRLENNPR